MERDVQCSLDECEEEEEWRTGGAAGGTAAHDPGE
jgi:hypothetical protein